ncbi:uncharacterized protein PRCAT00000581001 [Priceomyces carsonii]|uniref:uncharacterized protein n=1 Tax=Priceomyces carsonii TaxID=28549 RepID=UPI002EDAF76F|nr:unnamed protein product [Priceomyces carsonii]
MRFLAAIPVVLAVTSAYAVPHKRFNNETSSDVLGYNADKVATSLASSSDIDTTITIDKYVTIRLPSSTFTVAASETGDIEAIASSADVTPSTSTVIEYETLTSGSETKTIATTTYTTEVLPTVEASKNTTTTVTKTVSEDSGSGNEESCGANTVTVTVTKSGASDPTSTLYLTSTFTTSYPIEAVFTNGDDTTTLTSFVEVTSTLHYPKTSASVTPTHNNGTYSYSAPSTSAESEAAPVKRRGFIFDF